MSKTCNGCEAHENNNHEHDSFAVELLKGYKKQFHVVTAILSIIIATLLGYIIYDNYMDNQFETIEYVQDGEGYNNINTGTQGDVLNGTEAEDKTAN